MARVARGGWTLGPHYKTGGTRKEVEGYKTVYRCRNCSFNAYNKDDAKDHYFTMHYVEVSVVARVSERIEHPDLPEDDVVLTIELFNWMATQLTDARRARDEIEAQMNALMEHLQQFLVKRMESISQPQVSPELGKLYGAYQKSANPDV